MNERIIDLAAQANRDLDGNIPYGFAEKFAELIVNKCLEIIDEKVPGMAGVAAMKEIEEYFGVEE